MLNYQLRFFQMKNRFNGNNIHLNGNNLFKYIMPQNVTNNNLPDPVQLGQPLKSFHSWWLIFTQDGLAFSTKTFRRALQVQLRSALSTSWQAGSPHQARQSPHQTHPKPPNRAPWQLHLKPTLNTQALEGFEPNCWGDDGVGVQSCLLPKTVLLWLSRCVCLFVWLVE